MEERLQCFLKSDPLKKLVFAGDLDKYEKGIVEKLAVKWELTYSVDEATGVATVAKPVPKQVPVKKVVTKVGSHRLLP